VTRYFRKIIVIKATDSPNVRYALAQQAAGQEPDGRELVPGVIGWDEYKKRLATWDLVRRTVGLEAAFYKGAQVLLFPPERLTEAESVWRGLRGQQRRGKALGVDPAEGGDKTALCVIDERGIIELISRQTPDTDEVPGMVIAAGQRWGVPPDMWIFDRGGGGKEHADRLRARGYPCRTVAFGEAVRLEVKRTGVVRAFAERREVHEDRTAYLNRRAQMYHEASLLLDQYSSVAGGRMFGLPPGEEGPQYQQLRAQLAVMPRLEDREGKIYLPPKNRKDEKDAAKTLCEIIGHSPDEADSLVLAVHAWLHPVRRLVAGAV
jgi:hypothetical protein